MAHAHGNIAIPCLEHHRSSLCKAAASGDMKELREMQQTLTRARRFARRSL